MKLQNPVHSIFKFTILTIIIGLCITACKKPSNETATELTVTVVDSSGSHFVNGATVRVWVDTTLLTDKTKIPTGVPVTQQTDINGTTKFSFSFGLQVNIDAYLTFTTSGGKIDTSFFESNFSLMNDGEKNSKTLKLRRYHFYH